MKYFNILKKLNKKDYLEILSDSIRNKPQGLFYSLFRQEHKRIVYGQDYLQMIEVRFSTYHLCYGNDIDNVLYAVSSDLPFCYHKYVHKNNICHFNHIEKEYQKKIIDNLLFIDKFEDKTFDTLCEIIKNKIPRFILFEDRNHYKSLNQIYLKQNLENNLPKSLIKEKVKKI